MVDPLNVNRRSTEILFPFLFIYFFLYFFHKERTSKARGGSWGSSVGSQPLKKKENGSNESSVYLFSSYNLAYESSRQVLRRKQFISPGIES